MQYSTRPVAIVWKLVHFIKKLRVYRSNSSEVPAGLNSCSSSSVLGLSVPLHPAGLVYSKKCLELVLLAGLIQVWQHQSLGGLVPTLEVELGVGDAY